MSDLLALAISPVGYAGLYIWLVYRFNNHVREAEDIYREFVGNQDD